MVLARLPSKASHLVRLDHSDLSLSCVGMAPRAEYPRSCRRVRAMPCFFIRPRCWKLLPRHVPVATRCELVPLRSSTAASASRCAILNLFRIEYSLRTRSAKLEILHAVRIPMGAQQRLALRTCHIIASKGVCGRILKDTKLAAAHSALEIPTRLHRKTPDL